MSYEWVSQVALINESCRSCEWVMSHIWMRHVTPTNESWICHVAHINESSHDMTRWYGQHDKSMTRLSEWHDAFKCHDMSHDMTRWYGWYRRDSTWPNHLQTHLRQFSDFVFRYCVCASVDGWVWVWGVPPVWTRLFCFGWPGRRGGLP